MKYQYIKDKLNYESLSSGRVLYSFPGQSAFPVRLGSELIQRCFSLLDASGHKGPYTIYDPCCGGGYLLTTLGLLHNDRLKKIYASDIDAEALALTKKNLQLLSMAGLNKRINELTLLAETYHKSSHFEAIDDAIDLKHLLTHKIEIECFETDVTASEKLEIPQVDIVITDVPYGVMVNWKGQHESPLEAFFQEISHYLIPLHSILAVSMHKEERIKPSHLLKVEGFKVGSRQIKIFKKF